MPPDSLEMDAAYQDFCDIIKTQPKRLSDAGSEIAIFPAGMRSVNPWKELSCSLLRKTTQIWLLQLCLPSLTRSGGIDGPRQPEAVRSIDFSHSSRKEWSILNNLTGTSRHSPCHCLISADVIASQLVRNSRYKAVDCKSSRLVFQKVSDLWRVTTPDPVNISDNFLQKEFTPGLQHLKQGKTPGLDSIFPELILHV